jgi:hypothetical protein
VGRAALDEGCGAVAQQRGYPTLQYYPAPSGVVQSAVAAGPELEQGPTDRPEPLVEFRPPEPDFPGYAALMELIRERQEELKDDREFKRALQAWVDSRERVQCFFLDYYQDAGYVAPDSWAARRETLEYTWRQFVRDVASFEAKTGFEEDRWPELVAVNDVADVPGAFWQEGVAAGALKWTICMLVTYSCLLETSNIQGTGCDSALPGVRAWIESWRMKNFLSPGLYVSKSSLTTGSYLVGRICGLPSRVVEDTDASIAGGAPAAQASFTPGVLEIHLDPGFLLCMGEFADGWMAATHQLYWASKEAAARPGAGAASLEDQISRAGALALAPVAELALIVIHEFAHVGTGTHCEESCCQARLSAQWYASVASRNGVVGGPFMREPDGLNSDGTAVPPDGRVSLLTQCDDALGTPVVNTIQLAKPGVPAGYGDWSMTTALPATCP